MALEARPLRKRQGKGLTMTVQQQLTRLHRTHPTRYELAAVHPDGRRILVGYTVRKGRRSLLGAVRQRAEVLAALCGPEIAFGARVSDGATIGPWRIRYTGRTQREAVSCGELDYCEDV